MYIDISSVDQFMIKENGQKQNFAFIMMGMVVVLASVVMSKII